MHMYTLLDLRNESHADIPKLINKGNSFSN